ncbi:MAG: hypothetical protein JWQ73_3153 [Variovorax sp.]|nr:hypothetical protein [Variovorax sp.]
MATETNPFGDMTKLFEQFQIPGIDMTALLEARRKDVQALLDANKGTYESMQAMMAKQREMMMQAAQGMQDAAKLAMSGGADPSKLADTARQALEKTLSDMKELAEMGRQSQLDAMARLTQRATQQMAEVKKLMQPR